MNNKFQLLAFVKRIAPRPETCFACAIAMAQNPDSGAHYGRDLMELWQLRLGPLPYGLFRQAFANAGWPEFGRHVEIPSCRPKQAEVIAWIEANIQV